MNGRFASAASAVLFAAIAPAAIAADAPHVQQKIVPGRSIGDVKLGMSIAQVRRVLGPHESVNYDEQLSFGRRFRELAWNFGEWRIGFIGQAGSLRAGRIEASVRTERTPEGVGVGTPEARVERIYGTRCYQAWYTTQGGNPGAGKWCRVAGGSMYLVVDQVCRVSKIGAWTCPGDRWRSQVTSVIVTSAGPPPYVRITNDPGR